MTPVSTLSQQIWDMKYRLKTAAGAEVAATRADAESAERERIER